MRETGGGESEQGRCTCREETVLYCPRWTCSSMEIERVRRTRSNDGYGDDDKTVVRGKMTRCFCSRAAPNENYCQEWHCMETSTDGASQNEHYICLKEDESGEFCLRWKGDVSSNKEVESSVCQCTERGNRYCESWHCMKRGLGRCSERLGWCNFWVGVFVAGSIGLVFLLTGCGACFVAICGHYAGSITDGFCAR